MDQNPFSADPPPASGAPYQPVAPASVPSFTPPSAPQPWQQPVAPQQPEPLPQPFVPAQPYTQPNTPQQAAPAPSWPAQPSYQPAPVSQPAVPPAPQMLTPPSAAWQPAAPSSATLAPQVTPSWQPPASQSPYMMPASPSVAQPASLPPTPNIPGALPPEHEPGLRRLRKQMIVAMAAVSVFMIVGTIVVLWMVGRNAVDTTASSIDYSSAEMANYDDGGVLFEYPKAWVTVKNSAATDNANANVVAYFGDNADISSATVTLLLNSSVKNLQPLDQYSTSDLDTLVASFKTEALSSTFRDHFRTEVGCADAGQTTAEAAPDWYTLRGIKFTFDCKQADQQAVHITGYIGLSFGGTVYAFELATVGNVSSSNRAVLDGLLDTLVVD